MLFHYMFQAAAQTVSEAMRHCRHWVLVGSLFVRFFYYYFNFFSRFVYSILFLYLKMGKMAVGGRFICRGPRYVTHKTSAHRWHRLVPNGVQQRKNEYLKTKKIAAAHIWSSSSLSSIRLRNARTVAGCQSSNPSIIAFFIVFMANRYLLPFVLIHYVPNEARQVFFSFRCCVLCVCILLS